jgi:transcriptional regulator with XRE-family HTH domain
VAKIAALKALSQIREQRGLTPYKLSKVVKISEERLAQLEAGELASGGELKRLSEALGVPRYLLASENASVDQLIPDFRFQSISESDVGFGGLNQINDLGALKDLLSAISTSLKISTRFQTWQAQKVKKKEEVTDPELLASMIEKTLNFTVEYSEYESPSSFLEKARLHAEDAGIAVVARQLRQETFRGFCLSDEVAPSMSLTKSHLHAYLPCFMKSPTPSWVRAEYLTHLPAKQKLKSFVTQFLPTY